MFWKALAGNDAMRLALQFLRIDQPEHLWSLQQSQIIGVLVLLAFVAWAANLVRMRWALQE